MHQQFVEEVHGHLLLFLGHVSGIFVENIDVGPDLLPLFLRPGGLQQIAEGHFIIEYLHNGDIVLDGQILQPIDGLLAAQKRFVFLFGRSENRILRIGAYPQPLHKFLKILQLCVDPLIPLSLGLINVVQHIEDDVKGILQGIDPRELRAGIISDALDPEVRIDEHQGFG